MVGNVQSGGFGGDEEFGGCGQVGMEFAWLRDDTVGVQRNRLSRHELEAVVLAVLIFGGISCSLGGKRILRLLGNFPLGLKKVP